MSAVDALLAERRIAALGTLNADGSIHLTAVWYLYENGVFYVGTSGSSRKARNVAARPHASLIVDTRGDGALGGVAASGSAEVVRGAAARELNERIWARYLTEAGRADPLVGGTIAATDDVAIRLEPVSLRAWSTAEDFGGAFELPGIAFPLEP